MENPAHWTEAERVVHAALKSHEENTERGVVGISRAMAVTTALRRAGLLPASDGSNPQ